MSRKIDVLAVGELNPDLILTDITGLPELGKEKVAGQLAKRLGSSTAIAAGQMSKLGLKVALVSKVGQDEFGSYCKSELAKMNVDVSHIIESSSLSTGLTVSLSYPQDRMLITYIGSISALQASDVDDELLKQSSHLHVSSYYLQESLRPGLKGLLARARSLGVTTSLDTGDDPSGNWDDGIWDVLEQVDIFLPNERELTGIAKVNNVDEAVRQAATKARIVAAKLGSKGSILYHEGKLSRFTPYKVEPIDTTGAGDSFDAGFLYGFTKGYALAECMRLANACGALATTEQGGTVGFSSIAQVLNFAATQQLQD